MHLKNTFTSGVIRFISGVSLVLGMLCAAHAQDNRNLRVLATPGKRIALVIGNSAYERGPLANPVNDARAMAARLKSLGFETILRENLKTKEIGSVYREFRSKIIPGGVALVFYAGHGLQFKGQNYFPAVDAEIGGEEEVPLQSLNLGTLLDTMEEAKAGVNLVFLDACRDNPFARRFRSAANGLAKVEAASGTLIHYATKPGSVASDGEGLNGTYTEALLAQMGEPGIPVEQMLKRVTNNVVFRTKGRQEPWVEGSLRGDFYFYESPPAPTQIENFGAAPEPETQAWMAVNRSNTIAGYQSYLAAFPSGRYAVAAKIALDALKGTATSGALTTQGGVAAPAKTMTSPLPEDLDTSMWNEVKKSGDLEYLDAYLKQFPKGKYVALAKLELKKISRSGEAQQNDAFRMEAAQWRQMITIANEPSVVQAYLDRHPGKLEILKALAQGGDTEAQGHLARLYWSGWGVTSDTREAVLWAKKAADKGNAFGQTILGFAYATGQGFPKDDVESVRWFRKAAEQGNPSGQASLGGAYRQGVGVVKDPIESNRWLHKAAEQGFVPAQTSLGFVYATGDGVAKNIAEAVKWTRVAAEQGNDVAQNNLGDLYARGDGVAKDLVEAFKWIRKSAEQGNVGAQTSLGYYYETGNGVSKDPAEALKWYRAAAEQGYVVAQINLGNMYVRGDGVANDPITAVFWHRKAAEQGNAQAQGNIGYAYENGYGVAKDLSEAIKWYRMAAERGDPNSQNNLRRLGKM